MSCKENDKTVFYLVCVVSKSSIVTELGKRAFMISSEIPSTGLSSNTQHTYSATCINQQSYKIKQYCLNQYLPFAIKGMHNTAEPHSGMLMSTL